MSNFRIFEKYTLLNTLTSFSSHKSKLIYLRSIAKDDEYMRDYTFGRFLKLRYIEESDLNEPEKLENHIKEMYDMIGEFNSSLDNDKKFKDEFYVDLEEHEKRLYKEMYQRWPKKYMRIVEERKISIKNEKKFWFYSKILFGIALFYDFYLR